MRTLFFLIAFLPSIALGEIYDSNTFETIFSHASPKTLVVLDINNTLMHTAQELGSDRWAKYVIEKKMREENLSKEEVMSSFVTEWEKILLTSEVLPVEPLIPQWIYTLQKNNIPMIGLTARNVEMAYCTVNQLRSIDIDLSQTSPHPVTLEIVGGYASKHVQGIIFVGLSNDKGETLRRFLNQINCKPEKIFVVDDKKKNIESVQKAFEGICEVDGLHYHYFEKNAKPFNPEITDVQFKHYQKGYLSNRSAEILAEEGDKS